MIFKEIRDITSAKALIIFISLFVKLVNFYFYTILSSEIINEWLK